jgi:predicted glycosyltransferase
VPQLEELVTPGDSPAESTGVPAHGSPFPPPGSRVWIDLDNSPHVPFFAPILEELRRRGVVAVLTARDCYQVCGLADFHRLQYRKIGRHYGKNIVMKFLGLGLRALQMIPLALRERPALAISHGSRSQLVACRLLGIPTIIIGDYEHSTIFAFVHPKCLIVPEVIPSERLHKFRTRLLRYPGIKEDVYTARFRPHPGFRRELGIPEDKILVTVRPPATEAHYHVPESDELFSSVLDLLENDPHTAILFLPRNERQAAMLRARLPALFDTGQAIIPDRVLDGLNLVWHSDLVISGGGTMNREAAALGVPVYSIFRGPTGAVDQYLSAEGRLTLVTSRNEVFTKIQLKRRSRSTHARTLPTLALDSIVSHIVRILGEK